MRELLVVLAAVMLPGCSLINDDGIHDERGGKRKLTINWKLKMPGGADAPCPPGFADLLISSTTVEREGQVQTPVPCATSGTHVEELYTSGEHTFRMEDDPANIYVERFTENYEEIIYITDPTVTITRAVSLPIRVKLDKDKTVDVEIYPDGGHVLFSWGLNSGITGDRVYSCPAVAVDEVELHYRLFTFDGDPPAPSKSVRWPCGESHTEEGYYMSEYAVGQGFLPALAPESYVGELVGYRGGVEVARDPDVHFMVMTGGELTESSGGMTVEDR